MNPNFSAEITVTSLSDIIRQEDIVYKYFSGLKPLVHFDDITLLDNKIRLYSLIVLIFILYLGALRKSINLYLFQTFRLAIDFYGFCPRYSNQEQTWSFETGPLDSTLPYCYRMKMYIL